MTLSEKEFSMMEETEFLLTKIEIVAKIENLLKNTKETLKDVIENEGFNFLPKNVLADGKIFRGEYYRDLPYVILDFPSTFGKENIFAFRTMFWWGNFFSSTLHLQGDILEIYRDKLLSSFEKLLDQNLYICVGKTPWEYHYGKDNYAKLSSEHKEIIRFSPFIKLSRKIPLKQIDSVSQISSSFFHFLATILNN